MGRVQLEDTKEGSASVPYTTTRGWWKGGSQTYQCCWRHTGGICNIGSFTLAGWVWKETQASISFFEQHVYVHVLWIKIIHQSAYKLSWLSVISVVLYLCLVLNYRCTHVYFTDLTMPVDVELNVGDKVRTDQHLETFKHLLREYGGWHPDLETVTPYLIDIHV